MFKYKYEEHYKNTICHLFNRGVNKDKIFCDEEDYFFYLKRIKKYKELHKIEFISYALLPNHFHFIVRQLTDNDPSATGALRASVASTPVSKFMHILNNSYVHYFNKKYKRAGHLFQDRYKQKTVNDDKYLIWLSEYVNGNPAIHKIVDNLDDWQYSSYLDFIGKRNGVICNKESVLHYFGNGVRLLGESDSAKSTKYAAHVKDVIEMSRKRKEDLKDLEYGLGM